MMQQNGLHDNVSLSSYLTTSLFQVSSDWGTMTLPELEPDPSLTRTGAAREVTTSAPERASPSRTRPAISVRR